MKTFKELGVNPQIIRAIEDMGFERAMPVQEAVIPVLLERDTDLVALAQTGTGKTAAFGLPIIQKININKHNPEALILCPTRELCMQIAGDLKEYSKYLSNLNVVPVYGGANIDTQIKQLERGVNIIVATPGRMLDLMKRGKIDLKSIRYLVLDEADEMLDMGFQEELNDILKHTPAEKNTLLFSATMPVQVEKIARGYMKNPVEITIGERNSGSENIKHYCYLSHAKQRYLVLKRIVDYYPDIYAIIFCRTRKETQEVADWLIKDGYNADALHGDLSQLQRDNVMNKFRLKNLQLLVATDVAARGLDVDDLTHVINYNLPDETEQYTHRSGRTGRADKSGISIAIIHLKEKHKIKEIEKQIGKTFKFAKIPNGKEVCEKQLFHLIEKMEKVEVNESEISEFLPLVYKKLENISKEELIKRFVSLEFNRFLDYYRDTEDLNVVESKTEKKDKNSGNFTRLFINIGKLDGLQPSDLIGLINDVTHIRDIRIGKIDIMKTFSFFETDSNYVELLLAAFRKVKYEGRNVVLEQSSPKKKEKSDKNADFDNNFHSKKRKDKQNRRNFDNKERKGKNFSKSSSGRRR